MCHTLSSSSSSRFVLSFPCPLPASDMSTRPQLHAFDFIQAWVIIDLDPSRVISHVGYFFPLRMRSTCMHFRAIQLPKQFCNSRRPFYQRILSISLILCGWPQPTYRCGVWKRLGGPMPSVSFGTRAVNDGLQSWRTCWVERARYRPLGLRTDYLFVTLHLWSNFPPRLFAVVGCRPK